MAIAETRAPRAHLYTKQVLIALVATYLAVLSLAIDIPKPSGDGEYADQTYNMDDTTPRCDKLCNASCCFLNAPFVMCAKCDDNIECHPTAECFSEDDEKRKKIEDEQSAFQTVPQDDKKPCFSWCKVSEDDACCGFSEPERECAGCPEVDKEAHAAGEKVYGCNPKAKCYYKKNPEL